MELDRLLTIPEAARALRISRATLYSHIAAGRLEAVKIGSATRLREKIVAQFIENAPRLKPSLPASQPVTV